MLVHTPSRATVCLWVARVTLWPPSSAAHSYTKLPISFFCSPKLLHLSSALFQVLKSWVKLATRASPWPPRGLCAPSLSGWRQSRPVGDSTSGGGGRSGAPSAVVAAARGLAAAADDDDNAAVEQAWRAHRGQLSRRSQAAGVLAWRARLSQPLGRAAAAALPAAGFRPGPQQSGGRQLTGRWLRSGRFEWAEPRGPDRPSPQW